MSISGIYQFGTLTTKSGKVIDFDEIAKDSDGKISQQQYIFIQKELGLDTVEFLDESQREEDNFTEGQFAQWYQEGEMQKAFDSLCSQIAKDFIGVNAKYASQVLKELRTFLTDFKSEYLSGEKSLADLSEDFQTAIISKYEEIKSEVLGDENKKSYTKIQEEWDKYVKDFESNIKNVSSIDEFVKLNRDYIKMHGEYVQKMLACKDLEQGTRQSLIQSSKDDFESSKYYTKILGEGRHMQITTDNFINRLTENCPGWKDLENDSIISNSNMYMLEFFYAFSETHDLMKDSMSAAYFEKLEQYYSILETKYQHLLEAGQIDPDTNIEYKPKENKN